MSLSQGDEVAFSATNPAQILPLVGFALLFGVLLAPLVQRIARWAWPRAAAPTARVFGLRDIGLVALGFLLIQILAGIVIDLFDLDVHTLLVAMPATVFVQAATGGLILALAARAPRGFAALGLRGGQMPWALGYAAAKYVGAGPFLFALMAASPLFLERVLGIPHEPQDVALLIAGATDFERVLVPLFAALLIPLLEELMFRGFLQNALESLLGAAPAVVLTSVAFAALHGASAFIPIFGLSVLLGVVMLRTRRLAACWFVHGLHNGLTTSLLFLAPDTLLQP